MENISFNLAGVTFADHQKNIASLLQKKTKHLARLIKEPDNPWDPNAVKVCVDGHEIGYVPREVASLVSEIVPSVLKTVVELGYSKNQENYFAHCKLLILTKEDDE